MHQDNDPSNSMDTYALDNQRWIEEPSTAIVQQPDPTEQPRPIKEVRSMQEKDYRKAENDDGRETDK